ncbi:hypothetical protein KCU81_g124, partial [Aureobasidium melanogenum]
MPHSPPSSFVTATILVPACMQDARTIYLPSLGEENLFPADLGTGKNANVVVVTSFGRKFSSSSEVEKGGKVENLNVASSPPDQTSFPVCEKARVQASNSWTRISLAVSCAPVSATETSTVYTPPFEAVTPRICEDVGCQASDKTKISENMCQRRNSHEMLDKTRCSSVGDPEPEIDLK